MDKDQILDLCKPYSMTPRGRMAFLYSCCEAVTENNVPGAFVECGVWKGGNSMVMASYLQATGEDRPVWLYDTFTGMTEPTKEDVRKTGELACAKYFAGWHKIGIDTVRENMALTGYFDDQIYMIEGDVLWTLDAMRPKEIAILRLDTDWYESTKKELDVLFPRLQPGGWLIVDDYNCWLGSRKATDEYFAGQDIDIISIDNEAVAVQKW